MMNITSSRILIVDDEHDLGDLLSRVLHIAGFHTRLVASGADALAALNEETFDLIILDLLMPEMDGIEVLRRVRELNIDAEIIILTAAPSINSAIVGIRADVSDYLVKPISINDLIDAVNLALQKRHSRLQKELLDRTLDSSLELPDGSLKTPSPPGEIKLGTLRLDRSQQLFVFLEDEKPDVKLTRGETAILTGLMLEPERVFSCSQLANQAWGYSLSEEEAESIIRPYISRIRNKLESEGGVPEMIITVRGSGYYFKPLDE